MQSTHTTSRTLNWIWLLPWVIISVMTVLLIPSLTLHLTYKYFNIAYEMLVRHNFILPFWQGAPYSDKPPLVFWLIVLGWQVFGINNWWPQLLMLLVATGTLLMCQPLARRLWPAQPLPGLLAPYILLGLFNWTLFSQQIQVDPLLTFSCVLTWLGLLCTVRDKRWGWWLAFLGMSAGVMVKGPVIFVFCFIPSLFLPLFYRLNNPKKWLLMLLCICIGALAVASLWAIPAMTEGGRQYAHSILYGQISGRQASYHRDLFFYLQRLPQWLLPWLAYCPLWLALKPYWRARKTSSDKFCWFIIAIGFSVFSLFSQQSGHYLYPLYPIFALLLARILSHYQSNKRWPLLTAQWALGALLFAVAILLLLFSYAPTLFSLHVQEKFQYIAALNLAYPLMLLLVSSCLFFIRPKRLPYHIALFVCGIIAFNLVQYVALPTLKHNTQALIQQGPLWFSQPYHKYHYDNHPT